MSCFYKFSSSLFTIPLHSLLSTWEDFQILSQCNVFFPELLFDLKITTVFFFSFNTNIFHITCFINIVNQTLLLGGIELI